MTKNGRNKFGGSNNPNRTSDNRKARTEPLEPYSAAPFERRERIDKPRRPPRPEAAPYNGVRASNVAPSEYNQIKRVLEEVPGRIDIGDAVQFYKIYNSSERRAAIEEFLDLPPPGQYKTVRERGGNWKGLRGACPVVSDDTLRSQLHGARLAKFFAQSSPFYEVNRRSVRALRNIAPVVLKEKGTMFVREGVSIEYDIPEPTVYVGQYENRHYAKKPSRRERKIDNGTYKPGANHKSDALNGRQGEETDDNGVEALCMFPRATYDAYGWTTRMEPIYMSEKVMSASHKRYLVTRYATTDNYCAGAVIQPLQLCPQCRQCAAHNIAMMEIAIEELDDPPELYIPCTESCDPIIVTQPEGQFPDSQVRHLIACALIDPELTVNHRCTTLNGSHGEATESDDVKKSGGKNTTSVLSKIAGIEARLARLLVAPRNGRKMRKKGGGGGGGRSGGKTQTGKRKGTSRINRGATGAANVNVSALGNLHPHTQKYLIALSNPHSQNAEGVGSIVNAHKTRKANARHTFTVEPTNSAGVFLFFAPSGENNLAQIFQWQTPTTGVATYNGSVVTGDVSRSRIVFSELPYDSATLGSEGANTDNYHQSRILCLGVKVTAIGPIQFRGGELVFYEGDNHQNIVGSSANNANVIWTSINGKRTARRVDLARNQSHEFTITPHTQVEHEFRNSGLPNTFPNSYQYPFSEQGAQFGTTAQGGTANDGSPCMVLVFPETSAGTSVKYRIECILHVEYIGGVTKSSATPTHSDVLTGKMIAETVVKAKQTHHLEPHTNLVGDIFKNVMSELTAKAVKGGTEMLKKELANPELAGAASTFAMGLIGL